MPCLDRDHDTSSACTNCEDLGSNRQLDPVPQLQKSLKEIGALAIFSREGLVRQEAARAFGSRHRPFAALFTLGDQPRSGSCLLIGYLTTKPFGIVGDECPTQPTPGISTVPGASLRQRPLVSYVSSRRERAPRMTKETKGRQDSN